MRVNQITVFQITLENIVCLQNTCLVFVCILTSQLHLVSDKTAINFFSVILNVYENVDYGIET